MFFLKGFSLLYDLEQFKGSRPTDMGSIPSKPL